MVKQFYSWIPALLMMGIIFLFSAQPGDDLPDFGSWDYFVKKGGHMFGYALLAAAYRYGLKTKKPAWAWGLAILYAMTDEFHQTFVSGRHPSVFDILIFDNLGALTGLWILDRIRPSSFE